MCFWPFHKDSGETFVSSPLMTLTRPIFTSGPGIMQAYSLLQASNKGQKKSRWLSLAGFFKYWGG